MPDQCGSISEFFVAKHQDTFGFYGYRELNGCDEAGEALAASTCYAEQETEQTS
jgi:hypothetical protein